MVATFDATPSATLFVRHLKQQNEAIAFMARECGCLDSGPSWVPVIPQSLADGMFVLGHIEGQPFLCEREQGELWRPLDLIVGTLLCFGVGFRCSRPQAVGLITRIVEQPLEAANPCPVSCRGALSRHPEVRT